MLPAAAGYLLLAHPIVDLLIRHGALRAAAAGTTADVLALFALGLPAYSGYLLLVRGYTAMQDTRTPFILNTFENGLTIALDLVLYPIMGVEGLALGFSLGYVVSFAVAARDLRARTGGLGGPEVVQGVVRMAAATAVMTGVVAALAAALPGGSGAALAARVVVTVAAGVLVYVACTRRMHVREVMALLSPFWPTRGLTRSEAERRRAQAHDDDRGSDGHG